MKTAILFSGGKDSVVCLHMYRDKPDVTAYWCDTGASFPHMRSYVHETCTLWNIPLKVVRPEEHVLSYTETHGLPADIVPSDALPEVSFLFKAPGQTLQPYLRCCSEMLFKPILNAVKQDNCAIMVRGSKWSDQRVGVADCILDGIQIVQPLWNWTDAQVMGYVTEHSIILPVQYSEGCNSSLDCWLCTGHLAWDGKDRIEFTRRHYPTLYKILRKRLDRVRDTIQFHESRIKGVLE